MTSAAAVLLPVERTGTAPFPVLVPCLLSIAKATRQLISIKLANIDVVVGQDQLLLCLDGGESRPVSEIANTLSVRASTVSKMVDRLVEKGWVVRTSDTVDGRRTLVASTAAGRVVADQVREIAADLEAELWKSLGTDEDMMPVIAEVDAVLVRRLARLR